MVIIMNATNHNGVTRRRRRPSSAERAALAQAHENYFTAQRLHAEAAAKASATRDYRDVALASSAYLVMQMARGQFRAARTAARVRGAA